MFNMWSCVLYIIVRGIYTFSPQHKVKYVDVFSALGEALSSVPIFQNICFKPKKFNDWIIY